MLIICKTDIRPPTAPVLGTVAFVSATALTVPMTTPATDLVAVASYSLERATSASGPFTELTAAATFPYSDTGLTASTTYYYRARATDSSGNVGNYSAIVSGVTSAPVGNGTFPLTISGRYLLTQEGTRFFVNGDTPWSALVQLTDAQWTQYLTDRQTRGFNALLLNLIEHRFANSAPNMVQGNVAPFTTAEDIRTPNSAYFDRAVAMITEAANLGFYVLMTPAYYGFDAGSEGWYTSAIGTRTTGECQAYGAYLGTKFAGLPNICWVMGGDYYNASTLARTQAIVTGLKSTGRADWLFTYHASPGSSSADVVNGGAWLNLSSTYERSQSLLVADLVAD